MYSEFFDILSFVLASQPVTVAAVWAHFGVKNYRKTNEAIAELLSRGLLHRQRMLSEHLDRLTITTLGREALEREQQQREAAAEHQREKQAAETKRLQERHEDQANDERRYRTQNKIAVIMPLVTFVLGLLAEHFLQITALAAALVRLVQQFVRSL